MYYDLNFDLKNPPPKTMDIQIGKNQALKTEERKANLLVLVRMIIFLAYIFLLALPTLSLGDGSTIEHVILAVVMISHLFFSIVVTFLLSGAVKDYLIDVYMEMQYSSLELTEISCKSDVKEVNTLSKKHPLIKAYFVALQTQSRKPVYAEVRLMRAYDLDQRITDVKKAWFKRMGATEFDF